MTRAIDVPMFWSQWDALMLELKGAREALDRGRTSRVSMTELQARGWELIGAAKAHLDEQSAPDRAYVALVDLQNSLEGFDPARGAKEH